MNYQETTYQISSNRRRDYKSSEARMQSSDQQKNNKRKQINSKNFGLYCIQKKCALAGSLYQLDIYQLIKFQFVRNEKYQFQKAYSKAFCKQILDSIQNHAQNQKTYKKMKNTFTFLTKSIIHQKIIKGDFDAVLKQILAYKTTHMSIIQNLQQNNKKFKAKSWIIDDFFEIMKKQQKQSDQKMKFYFQIKRNFNNKNLDHQKSEGYIMKKQKKKQNQQQQKLAQWLDNQQNQLLKKFVEGPNIKNVSQLLKIILAAKIQQFQKQYSQAKIPNFISFLSNNKQINFTVEKTELKIILYLIINKEMPKQNFIKIMQPIKDILGVCFKNLNAVLHVIGYSPKSEQEVRYQQKLQKARQQVQQYNQKYLTIKQECQRLRENFQKANKELIHYKEEYQKLKDKSQNNC